MIEYEAMISEAEREGARGRYKEAYRILGRALTIGGSADRECGYWRGVYALRIAHARLEQLERSRERGRPLSKVACWLSRSEAYLVSAMEWAPEEERRRIEELLATARQDQERFRALWASGLPLTPAPPDL